MFHCEHMNILKVGLETAHRVVAVSPGYAWECQVSRSWGQRGEGGGGGKDEALV